MPVVVHQPDPSHLIVCFELFRHAIDFCHAGDDGVHHTLSLYVNLMQMLPMEIVCIKPFKIVLLRAEKKQKETYSEHEIAALIQKPNLNTCAFAEFRNWAIVNYLLATGNRLETLLHIKIGDVDFVEREIRLTKLRNRRQYTIPLLAILLILKYNC